MRAISAGALSHCTFLALYKNQIDDVGAMALGAVLRAGRLRAVKTLCLNSNEIGCAGVAALATAARHGALASLEKLSLCSNAIGDAGIVELAAAASCGSFASVKYLVLERNAIGERGMRARRRDLLRRLRGGDGAVPQQMEHRIFLECNPAPAKPVHGRSTPRGDRRRSSSGGRRGEGGTSRWCPPWGSWGSCRAVF